MRHSRAFSSFAILFIFGLAIVGCRSHGVLVTVRNESGTEIRNLEVQYPGGSFGKSALPKNGSYSYRVKVLRDGGILVAFEDVDGQAHQSTGPTYASNADGTLTVTINPQNTVTFAQR